MGITKKPYTFFVLLEKEWGGVFDMCVWKIYVFILVKEFFWKKKW